MQTYEQPMDFKLNGSPGQIAVEAGATRIIPSDTSGSTAALKRTYTGDGRRSKITIRNCSSTDSDVLYWTKTNYKFKSPADSYPGGGTVAAITTTNAYPLLPGEEKSFPITSSVGLYIYNPTAGAVSVAYDETANL